MLCTILPEEIALVGEAPILHVSRTEIRLSSRFYGTIKVGPKVECVQRVNDYIAWVMYCQDISKRHQGRIALYLLNYLESKK